MAVLRFRTAAIQEASKIIAEKGDFGMLPDIVSARILWMHGRMPWLLGKDIRHRSGEPSLVTARQLSFSDSTSIGDCPL